MKFTVEPVQLTYYRVVGAPLPLFSSDAQAQECADFLNSLVPEPAKRSVYAEPGDARDAINHPICDQAQFSLRQHFSPATDFAQGYNWERNVVLFDPTAPVIPVFPNWRDGEDSFASTFERRRKISETPLAWIRCPKNFEWYEGSRAGDAKLNGICVALGEDNRTVHHLYNFCVDNGVAYARAAQTWPKWAYDQFGRYIDGPLYYGSQGGSRLRAGTIRYGEFTAGPAMHALGCIMPSKFRYRVQPTVKNGEECLSYDISNTWITPALQADRWDSYSGMDPHRRAGTRYALPRDISYAMRTLPGAWFAQTMYWFGCYDVDAGAGQPGFAWSIEPNTGQRSDVDRGVAIRAIDAFTEKHGFSPRVINWTGFGAPRQKGMLSTDHFAFLLDMDDIWGSVRAVLDNYPGRWGGAGAPRVALKGAILEQF